MIPMQKIKIVAMSNPVSVGQMVLDAMNKNAAQEEVAVAVKISLEEITKSVWLNGNLVSENGNYFPQLTLHTHAGAKMLEAAAEELRAVGFQENEWSAGREANRVCLRITAPYHNAQSAFVALSGMVWEACNRTGLQYASLTA